MATDLTPDELCCVAAVRADGHKYVYFYRLSQSVKVVRAIARTTDDPELSLTWDDAVWLMEVVRQRLAGECGGCREE